MTHPVGKPVRLCAAALLLGTLLGGCGMPAILEGEETAADVAEAYMEEQSYREALQSYQTALSLGEESAEIYRGIGIADLKLGDYASAEEAFGEALRRCGGIPGALAFDLSYYLAETYTEQGKNESAIAVYDAILDLRKNDEDARYLRGIAYLKCGKHDSATADFESMLSQKEPQYDRILTVYEALAAAGYGPEGRKMLDDLMQDHAESMTSYEKGRIYYYLGNLEQAKSFLEEASNETASAKASSRVPVVILLGEVAQDLGDDTYAISVYRRFLQEDQSQAGIYNALGVCEMRMGNYSDALSDFQIGLNLNDMEQTPALIRNMAAAYEYMGNFQLAAERMEEYLNYNPTDEAALRENIFLTTRVAEMDSAEQENDNG